MSVAALGVCLALAASLSPEAGIDPQPAPASQAGVRFVPATQFTLAWTHSIEKTAWQEDYRVEHGPDARPRLLLERARIRGSGAGMEPPAHAALQDGWYHYVPQEQPCGPLRLTRSGYTPDYSWCAQEKCRPLGDLLPSDGGITLLWPCTGPQPD